MKNKPSIPNGKYKCKITDVKLIISTPDKLIHFKWNFKITDGEFKGEEIIKQSNISSISALAFLKSELFRFGIEYNDASCLVEPEVLSKIINKDVHVKLIPHKGFKSVYIHKIFNGGI